MSRIVRVFTVVIDPALREPFKRDFTTVSVVAVMDSPGALDCRVLHPSRWASDTYALVSTWADEASLVAFAGDDWNRPVIAEAMERYVRQASVEHFLDRS